MSMNDQTVAFITLASTHDLGLREHRRQASSATGGHSYDLVFLARGLSRVGQTRLRYTSTARESRGPSGSVSNTRSFDDGQTHA